MALKPVGNQESITTSGSSAKSGAIDQKTKYLRVVAISNDAYIQVGPESPDPTATSASFYLVEDKPEILSLGSVRAQTVQNVTKGATTVIDFQSGTGSQFVVGDYVSLTAPGQTGFNFSFKEVTAVNNTANFDGYHGTRITVDYNSTGVSGTWDQTKEGSDLRASFKVAALQAGGAGTVKVQQVQIVGDA
tara:strand:- start:1391 stop:1960 length:570 start_codon:yes stop_codon:yes gene_type:complete